MMVVFTLSTIILVVVILYMKSSTPRRFRHPWFGGVTDWYRSIVYSELSISNHIRYTNYKYIGTESLLFKVFKATILLETNNFLVKVGACAHTLGSVSRWDGTKVVIVEQYE